MNTAQLKTVYKEKIAPELKKQFNYSSTMQIPVLKKIVVNQGLGDATQDKKMIDVAINEITAITGQKAVATFSKKDIANFKLRKKMPIGVKHDAADRDAAGFHGHEFVFLAEIAHGHDGGEEDGDGKGHGDEGGGGIEEEFGDDTDFKAFAHKVVDVFPYELHEEHKDGDGKGEQQRAEEGLEDELVYLFHGG